MSQAQVGPGRGQPPSIPRWVKVFGIIAAVLVVGFVILHLTGHGFGNHTMPMNGQANTGGIGGPVNASEATRTVAVTSLDAMTFEPTSINVATGETVTFVVTNAGKSVHEFTLGDAALQQAHATAMAQMAGAMVMDDPDSISLKPGETKQLTWRFGSAGTLEYGCHEPGHYQAGMHGLITIK